MAQNKPARDPEELRTDVEAVLAVYGSLRVRVDVHDSVVRLRGVAPTIQIIREATRLAASVEGVERVENEIYVPDDYRLESSALDELPETRTEVSLEHLEEEGLLPPEDTPDLQERVGSNDALSVIEDFDEPYTPPTDPVVLTTGDGTENLEVLGGFATTALDDTDDQTSHAPNAPHSDDEVREDIEVALSRDAATNSLDVHVEVNRGNVRLTGNVTSLDDIDIAEDVVRRVPQVIDVENDLLVEGIE